MGLPHVLVRFYTNPDGRAARRTTARRARRCSASSTCSPRSTGRWVALYAPDLLLTGRTDAVVLLLPGRMLGDRGQGLLSALVIARGVRGVPVDEQRSHRVGRRRPAARTSCADACGRACADSGSAPPSLSPSRRCLSLADPADVARGHGRPGVRDGRVDVLPAARARHLVARAHHARRGRRAWSPAAASPPRRSWPRSPAARAGGWRAPCWPSPRPGRCRSAFTVMVGGVPAHRAARCPPSTGRVLARLHAPEALGLEGTPAPAPR